MKNLKKLSKPNTWIFIIFPFLMIAAYFGILIYEVATEVYDASLTVLSEILFIMAVILGSAGILIQLIRRKSIWRVVVTILFVVCFLGLRISYTAMIPKHINVCTEYETRYEEWKNTPYENRDEFWDKHEAMQQAADSMGDIGFTVKFLHLGSLVALLFARFCEGNLKKEEPIKEGTEQDSPG